jgi:HD domain
MEKNSLGIGMPTTPELKTLLLPSVSDPKLISILGFLNELEHLKSVYRQNLVVDGSRHENSAEHSWHIAEGSVALWAAAQDIIAQSVSEGIYLAG